MASIDGNMFVPDGSNNIFTSIREELAREVPTLMQMQDDLKKELEDPEISLLRNIRHLSVAELECLDVHSGIFKIPGGTMEGEHLLSKKKRKIHARRSYHYKIGKYESSPYYINFLSDAIVLVPGANDDSVRNQTKRLSLNPKNLSIKFSCFSIPSVSCNSMFFRINAAFVVIILSSSFPRVLPCALFASKIAVERSSVCLFLTVTRVAPEGASSGLDTMSGLFLCTKAASR